MIATPIIAHRGLSSLCPENTLIAMKAAAKIGATWVEVDTQLLQDGTPVILHDNDLERTTDARGSISNYTITTIEDIDAGSWFDERFSGEKLPTLKEMLEIVDELNLGLNLEIKYHQDTHGSYSEEELANFISIMLTQIHRSPAPPRGLIVSSTHLPFLQELRRQNTKINIGCIFAHWQEDNFELATSINAVSIHISKDTLLADSSVGSAIVQKIKNESMDLYVYTVNEADEGQTLFDMGVDGIFTDYPQLFKKYLP